MLKLKDAHRLQKLFSMNTMAILAGLSSEYAEGDTKEFKEQYGCTPKQMFESLNELKAFINK
jgi:AraC-like DNA-binding protein